MIIKVSNWSGSKQNTMMCRAHLTLTVIFACPTLNTVPKLHQILKFNRHVKKKKKTGPILFYYSLVLFNKEMYKKIGIEKHVLG